MLFNRAFRASSVTIFLRTLIVPAILWWTSWSLHCIINVFSSWRWTRTFIFLRIQGFFYLSIIFRATFSPPWATFIRIRTGSSWISRAATTSTATSTGRTHLMRVKVFGGTCSSEIRPTRIFWNTWACFYCPRHTMVRDDDGGKQRRIFLN